MSLCLREQERQAIEGFRAGLAQRFGTNRHRELGWTDDGAPTGTPALLDTRYQHPLAQLGLRPGQAPSWVPGSCPTPLTHGTHLWPLQHPPLTRSTHLSHTPTQSPPLPHAAPTSRTLTQSTQLPPAAPTSCTRSTRFPWTQSTHRSPTAPTLCTPTP